MSVLHVCSFGGEPYFGPNVLVFDPSSSSMQSQVDAIFAKQEANQFGSERVAILFKPGKYALDVPVGFYTHVAGLGKSPDDVEITGGVTSRAAWMKGNATCNFWRAVENLSVVPTQENQVNVWAVSQGVAMRRTHVKGDLHLWDGGWSSGGFLADSKIDGSVVSGSQQQWLSRNVEWNNWQGGSWNMVFVGATNPPSGSWPDKPYTVIEKTPLIREKPYLIIDADGNYSVIVPELESEGTKGVSWSSGASAGKSISLDEFYLAHPDKDSAETINAALQGGKHLLFTPGIYHLNSPIHVTRADTVVLGLGYPTLVPTNGTPAMLIDDVDGVKVAGILFEAGETEAPTLLQVGESTSATSHTANPIVLYDVFCRAGGAAVGKASCFVTINSNNVVGDNFWLWRADHGKGAAWDQNRNRNGLIVNGNDVTIYGLFVEHCQEYQTLWNGNGGRVYFYQSEMPYDPPTQEACSDDGVRGFASYKVADTVTTHGAWGLGVYCVFHAGPIIADTAIEAPITPGIQLHNMVAVRLSGKPDSGIGHVVNKQGEPVINSRLSRVIELDR